MLYGTEKQESFPPPTKTTFQFRKRIHNNICTSFRFVSVLSLLLLLLLLHSAHANNEDHTTTIKIQLISIVQRHRNQIQLNLILFDVFCVHTFRWFSFASTPTDNFHSTEFIFLFNK